MAQLGPGQVCGEMAFLENGLASANATAEEDVEAYALEWKQVMDLFELFPHHCVPLLSLACRKSVAEAAGADCAQAERSLGYAPRD